MSFIPPSMPREDLVTGFDILGQFTDGVTDLNVLAGWAGATQARWDIANGLKAAMHEKGLQISPAWEQALDDALETDERNIRVNHFPAWTMRNVWNTAYAAIHDALLRAKGHPGIPAQLVESHNFPADLEQYYAQLPTTALTLEM
jgi:hypothetical protein